MRTDERRKNEGEEGGMGKTGIGGAVDETVRSIDSDLLSADRDAIMNHIMERVGEMDKEDGSGRTSQVMGV